MDKLRATLARKVGPFSVGVWILIAVAGIGIGLFVRRRFGFAATEEDSSGQVGENRDDFPQGIADRVIVTGRAPTTVFDDDEEIIEDDETVGRVPSERDPSGRFPGGGDVNRAIRNIIVRRKRKVAVKIVPLPSGKTKKKVPVPAPKAITTPKARTYVVVKGDNLTKIARKFGTTWPKIYAANRALIGSNPDLIHPGQKLVIPAA